MNVLDLFRLEGKTALVTGCKRGIGKAMAHGAGRSWRGHCGRQRARLEPSGSEIEHGGDGTGP